MPVKKMKKEVAKKVKVEKPKKEKAVEVEFKVETPIHEADYWVSRPLDDKHLDWDYPGSWIDGYWQSQDHPHRQLTLEALRDLEFNSLVELGCNCGPNLALIKKEYPNVSLAGIDVEPRVIEKAKDELRDVRFEVGNITKLPFDTQSFDVVLADAVLMYLNPDDLKLALDEVERVARKAVVVIDRFDESVEGVRSGDVRARNYLQLFLDRGFKVDVKKISKKDWPGGVGWQKLGHIFVATRYEN